MVAPGRLNVRNITIMFSIIQMVNVYKLKTLKPSLLWGGQKQPLSKDCVLGLKCDFSLQSAAETLKMTHDLRLFCCHLW